MKCLQPAVWLFNKLPRQAACIRSALVCEKCAWCHSDVMSSGLIASYGFQLGCWVLGGTVSQADPCLGWKQHPKPTSFPASPDPDSWLDRKTLTFSPIAQKQQLSVHFSEHAQAHPRPLLTAAVGSAQVTFLWWLRVGVHCCNCNLYCWKRSNAKLAKREGPNSGRIPVLMRGQTPGRCWITADRVILVVKFFIFWVSI